MILYTLYIIYIIILRNNSPNNYPSLSNSFLNTLPNTCKQKRDNNPPIPIAAVGFSSHPPTVI